MSWSLRKADVKLAVTRFLPEVAPASPVDEPKPIAGLSPLARALWRDKREKECEKVPPAIEYPDWRIDELADKYAPKDAYEPDEVDDE